MSPFSILLATVCIALASIALGLVAAAWCSSALSLGQRMVRGSVVTVGAATVLLAAIGPYGQAAR